MYNFITQVFFSVADFMFSDSNLIFMPIQIKFLSVSDIYFFHFQIIFFKFQGSGHDLWVAWVVTGSIIKKAQGRLHLCCFQEMRVFWETWLNTFYTLYSHD